jgi:ubiquinone/menaquinone biosynthesis C-methylase UbiE
MLRKALHRVVQNPWVYDRIQFLAGAEHTRRRLAAQIGRLSAATSVLDLGGGTGLYQSLWPSHCNYVCLDVDMVKLRGFLSKQASGIALRADATRVPIRSASVDVVMCIAVSHHLTDELLEQLIDESARVLKDEGTFIFVDPVWETGKLAGRLLWKYDRGSYPRTAECLRSVVSNHYRLIHDAQYSVHHEYLLCVGVKEFNLSDL